MDDPIVCLIIVIFVVALLLAVLGLGELIIYLSTRKPSANSHSHGLARLLRTRESRGYTSVSAQGKPSVRGGCPNVDGQESYPSISTHRQFKSSTVRRRRLGTMMSLQPASSQNIISKRNRHAQS